MVKVHIGERVRNGRGEIGVISTLDNQCITINYPTRTASVVLDAFEKGYIKYESKELQSEVLESISKTKLIKKQKTEDRIARKTVILRNAQPAIKV